MGGRRQIDIFEDTWILTQCGRCFSNCGIRVRRVNGVAVQIEGNPDTWQGSKGGVCGKGASGLQLLYDPNRLNVPLRRTNPQKGLYADPKWKEISWEEALDEVAERLKKVLADDPRKIFLQSTTVRSPTASQGWRRFLASVLGTPNGSVGGAGIHCGNGGHMAGGLLHGSWDILPDYRYCNYAIYFGSNNGHGTGHAAMSLARVTAEAMERGMKLVVFDPLCNFSSAKATEWVPIRPGTDGAVALAMTNVILNELGIKDETYLKLKTNAPYLVGPEGRYVRDPETSKPLVWDANAGKARVFDDPIVGGHALEGSYEVDGALCHPAFEAVKQHLLKYTPEMASGVSQVPAGTIRRIAAEFADAAQIGSTITIDGHQFPYRPVTALTFRGGQGHGNAFHTALGIFLLNHFLGAADVPGGALGMPCRSLGRPETGRPQFSPAAGADGMLTAPLWATPHTPWPVHAPKWPTDLGLLEFFTLSSGSPVWGMQNAESLWKKIELPYRAEVLLNFGCNSVMGIANPEAQEEFLKNIPFIVSWDLYANELAEGFADILLPDTCYLETFTFVDGLGFNFNYPVGMDPWGFHITQPTVQPEGQRRYIMDVTFDLLERLGKRAEVNQFWNRFIGLEGDERFAPEERLTWDRVGDVALRHYFGPDRGMAWFKEHGFLSWPKRIEEAYWKWFVNARVPIYFEFMVDLREQMKEIGAQIGINLDWDRYTPLIGWYPVAPHQVSDPRYDLYAFSYRDIAHTSSSTMQTPYLDEVSAMNPYTYNVTMNVDTANRKGLRDGDLVEIESAYGKSTTGILKTRKGQHPETLSIMGTAGHWAKGQPVARGKGTNFSLLMDARMEECDPITLNLELCLRVRVTKLERK